MKKHLILICIAMSLLCACDESETPTPITLSGNYEGTFIRSSPYALDSVANVSLIFTENTFVGSSDTYKYPAICRGTFDATDNKISFTNECIWTAEFDWSLILSGDYSATIKDDKITLTKKSESSSDTYILTKK